MKIKKVSLGFILLITIMFSSGHVIAKAQDTKDYRYRYFSDIHLPEGFTGVEVSQLTSSSLNNNGYIPVTLNNCTLTKCVNSVALYNYATKKFKILQTGTHYHAGSAVNAQGTVEGKIVQRTADNASSYLSSLFFKTKRPPTTSYLPGESSSDVSDLNDNNTALVVSYPKQHSHDDPVILLYKQGKINPLNIGTTVSPHFLFDATTLPPFLNSSLRINNADVIIGTYGNYFSSRGFRFDSRTGKFMQLNPLSTEPAAHAVDINNKGEVLGYSRGYLGNDAERIGIWDNKGQFKTYFIQNTPESPETSSTLAFNDNNLIVVSDVEGSDIGPYLITKPGVHLKLVDLIENLPQEVTLKTIQSINNQGDMVGDGYINQGDRAEKNVTFMLKRIGVF